MMLEAVYLFVAVFFCFRVVFTNEWQASFWLKVLTYFIAVPVVTITWIALVRYFT